MASMFGGGQSMPTEKAPPIISAAMPYTGGDVKKSEELRKIFEDPFKTQDAGNLDLSLMLPRTGSFGVSGYTASFTAGVSGPLNSSGAPRKVSGPLDPTLAAKLQRTSMANN